MGAKITNINIYLPQNTLTNDSLFVESHNWDPIKIENKIGVRERRITRKNETSVDLAYSVSKLLLNNYDKDKIDMLILCTQSPDYFLPTSACILQNLLNLRTDIGAFDFNLGCSGFIYGLAMSTSFIESRIANSVLLIMSETYSKFIENSDYSNRSIFGDGAAACIIERSNMNSIGKFILGTDGSGWNNLIVANGCARNNFNEIDRISNDDENKFLRPYLKMNGPEIFNFTIERIPKLIYECLKKNNITIDEIDFFIFHQANKYILEYLRNKLKISDKKFYINLSNTGNTVSASIPIAMYDLIKNGTLNKGDKIILCGFGVGYSWGATFITI